MTQYEINFLLYVLVGLITVLSFIGALCVKQLISMATDINQIKISMERVVTTQEDHEKNHKSLSKRVDRLEERTFQ